MFAGVNTGFCFSNEAGGEWHFAGRDNVHAQGSFELANF